MAQGSTTIAASTDHAAEVDGTHIANQSYDHAKWDGLKSIYNKGMHQPHHSRRHGLQDVSLCLLKTMLDPIKYQDALAAFLILPGFIMEMRRGIKPRNIKRWLAAMTVVAKTNSNMLVDTLYTEYVHEKTMSGSQTRLSDQGAGIVISWQ
jgi:hypothetical protein